MSAGRPPGVGAELPRGREGLCGFSPEPEDELCPDDAEVHVIVISGARGLVLLPACTRHAPIARVAGRFVAEHSFTAVCADPSSTWDRAAQVCRALERATAESHTDRGGESR